MLFLFLLGAALPAQQAGVADQLLKDGWKAVEELGRQPKLKPELEKLAESDDEELRWWAGATLSEIDARAHGTADVEARRVTLEAKERPAHEILSELLAPDQFHLVGDLKAAEKPISVRFQEVPILQALDDVCREADCALIRRSGAALEVRVAGPTERPNAYAGPTALTVLGRTYLTTAEFRDPPQHKLQLELVVRMDPRVWVSYRRTEWRLVSAKDDTGKALGVDELNGWGASLNEQPYSFTIRPTVSTPTGAAKSLRSLRGIASVHICKTPGDAVFDNVRSAAGQTRQVGAIKITLRSFEFEDRKYSAILDYEPKDSPDAPELDDLELQDAKGARIHYRGGSSGNGSIVCWFDGSHPEREPTKLRVQVLNGLHVRKVYYELRDVPIR
jgi:hypothetical protein